jgi:TRAP-type C4-dicarboxylate transport system permease small subunit
MTWRSRLTHALRSLCHLLAGAALLAMLGVTVCDVVGRKLFNTPIVGVVDMVSFCVMWATMLGIALAWSQRAHIVVDLLDMTGSPGLVAVLDWLTRIAGIVVMPLLMWLAWHETRDVMGFGDRTPEIAIPVYWFWLAAVAGYALSAIFLLIEPPAAARSRDA